VAEDRSRADAASAARALGATLIDVVETRLELAATELAQERLRLARQWLDATLALWTLAVGVVFAGAAFALASPPAQRAATLAVLALLFIATGMWAVWRWRLRARRKPPLLDVTLRTLRDDAAALRPARDAARPAV